ncbi:MAG: hypothetical protein CME69_04975 [Halobacteriovorax sp.]|nr:hypothetical protein [Halobacteriovorax sp.]MEE3078099.1 hypothetical protein [Bdellovibrionota bacterium]
MNELYDKLILRVIFAVLVCFMIYIYKQAHLVLYPSIKHQLLKKFFPSKNSTDTIHLFARIIGLGLIFSDFHINLSSGIGVAFMAMMIESLIIIALYLGSIYIIESVTLYNFEYADEILRRKNYSYSVICFSHSIGLALLINTIVKVSQGSLIIIFFLWLFSMVLIGFGAKSFPLLSKLSFNRLLVQKNIAIAFSYTGFFWGQCLIISSAFDHTLTDIRWYSIQVITKIILSLIIIPIFMKALVFIFNIQNEVPTTTDKNGVISSDVEIGYGIYEGAIIFTTCFLTTVITGQITFGSFYPTY